MTTARIRVESIAPPRTPLLDGALARIDFADAFRARLPAGAPADPDAVASALVDVFETQPAMRFILRLRDAIVRPFGLTSSDTFKTPAPHSFRPGERSPLFRVLARNDDEILFGEDDSHLDFRLSILVERGPSGAFLTLTTVVQMNNWLGRAYFAVVRWGHRIIVPALMRRAVRKLVAGR